jgi:hypothetical protein
MTNYKLTKKYHTRSSNATIYDWTIYDLRMKFTIDDLRFYAANRKSEINQFIRTS